MVNPKLELVSWFCDERGSLGVSWGKWGVREYSGFCWEDEGSETKNSFSEPFV